MDGKSCCFTGHRPAKLPWGNDEWDSRCLRLKEALEDSVAWLYERGYRRFICGMAMGCDMYFAEAVLRLRGLHPDISLEAAVPFREQASRWSEDKRERYELLLSECDSVDVLQDAYSFDCMMRRNRFMVDRSAFLLACFNGEKGGTMNTILYAKQQGLEVKIIEIADDIG